MSGTGSFLLRIPATIIRNPSPASQDESPISLLFRNACLMRPPANCPAAKSSTNTGMSAQFQPSSQRRRPIAIGTGTCIAAIHCNENFRVFPRQYPKITFIIKITAMTMTNFMFVYLSIECSNTLTYRRFRANIPWIRVYLSRSPERDCLITAFPYVKRGIDTEG